MDLIYYDGGNIEKRKKVEAVLQTFPIQYAMIETNDGNQTIGALIGLEEKQTVPPCTMPQLDLMIFHQVEDEQISAISSALKDNDCHVERKCVVTKHNQTWKLKDLLEEIMEEHTYFKLYDACKKEIMEVSTMNEDDYTKESWNAYQTAFMQGLIMMQEGQPPKDQLEAVVQNIIKTKAALVKK